MSIAFNSYIFTGREGNSMFSNKTDTNKQDKK